MASPRRKRRLSPRKQLDGPRRLLHQRTIVSGFGVMAILALAVFFARSSGRSTAPPIGRADPANVEQVAVGMRIYATRCASCHGPGLAGEPGALPAPPLDATGQTWQHDDQWLFKVIKEGGQATAPPGSTSAMPPFGGGLTDAQIWAVIAFIKSGWPEHMRAAQPQR